MQNLKLINSLGRIVNFAYYSGYFPCYYNQDAQHFEIKTKTLSWIGFNIHLIMTALYMFYTIAKTIYLIRIPGSKLEIIFLHLQFSIIFIIMFTGVIWNIWNPFNKLDKILQRYLFESFQKLEYFTEIKMQEYSVRRITSILNFFLLACFVTPLNRAIIAYIFPTRTEYVLSSFYNNDSEVSLFLKIVSFTVTLQIAGFIVTTVMLNFGIILCIVFSLLLSIQRLSFECNSKPVSPFSSTEFIHNYRILQVIQAELIEHYGYSILSYQMIGLIGTTWQLFQGILFHSIRGLILGFGVLVCANEYMKFCSQIHENATKLTMELKVKSNYNTYGTKFWMSCRPIRVPIGHFFYYDTSLKLTSLRIVFDSFLNLIIVFKR